MAGCSVDFGDNDKWRTGAHKRLSSLQLSLSRDLLSDPLRRAADIEESPRDPRERRLSKYQKGRAYEGTRARKSRFFSRSTSMLFLPFVRITSPVRLPTSSRSHAANARSLVHVKICRVRAHVYARVCVRARTCLSSRFTRVCSHVRVVHVHSAMVYTLDHPPVHPPRKLEIVLIRRAWRAISPESGETLHSCESHDFQKSQGSFLGDGNGDFVMNGSNGEARANTTEFRERVSKIRKDVMMNRVKRLSRFYID